MCIRDSFVKTKLPVGTVFFLFGDKIVRQTAGAIPTGDYKDLDESYVTLFFFFFSGSLVTELKHNGK